MKVLYDSKIFQMQKFGGISRYFYKIIKNRNNSFDYHISGLYSDNIYLKELNKVKEFPIKRQFKGKGRIISLINKISDENNIKSNEYDLFHPTYYNPAYYPENKPIIVTAHDFIHEIYPSNFKNDRTSFYKKISLEKASGIIAISENTKKDLLKFYPAIDESKIKIIYHAVEWNAKEKHEMQLKIDKPYILFTGQRAIYKNFTLFVESISELLKKYDLNLVCTGPEFTRPEIELLNNLSIQNRAFSMYVDENNLKSLYENAICFVFPSLYEGFGFPILEAFASECPVVLSNTSCFPEIAGDAGEYFDPLSKDDIMGKVDRVITSAKLRNELINKGNKRLPFFSMGKFEQETINFYKETIEKY